MRTKSDPIESIVQDIRYYSKFFVKLAFEKEEDPTLNKTIKDINTLEVNVAFPFLLEVLVDMDNNLLTKEETMEIFRLVENYVFRRWVCDIPTNSLNKTFAYLTDEIEKTNYLESLKAALVLKESYRRFPNDLEFKESFMEKNIYNSKNKKYLFDKIENFGLKEIVNVDNYTIEHIMPQNKNISDQWKNDLGEKYAEIHEKYLHTIGNLTLTGYNPELNDRSFLEKRYMKGGFGDSAIRLNSRLAKLEHWNETEILNRAQELAQKALEIWEFPKISPEMLEKYKTFEEDVEEEFEGEEPKKPSWDEKYANASINVQQNIDDIIARVEKSQFYCVPYYKWLFLYTAKPFERKNLFSVITCGKNTSNVIFRIDPNTFTEANDNVRRVAGWFFPRGTERRISLTEENIPDIMNYLEHASTTT